MECDYISMVWCRCKKIPKYIFKIPSWQTVGYFLLLSMDSTEKTVVCGDKAMKLNEFAAYCAKSLSGGEKSITTDME